MGDLKELVDEAMMDASDLPHSDGYTINGELGDFCNCSQGTSTKLNKLSFRLPAKYIFTIKYCDFQIIDCT